MNIQDRDYFAETFEKNSTADFAANDDCRDREDL